jgi:hypothetical protein
MKCPQAACHGTLRPCTRYPKMLQCPVCKVYTPGATTLTPEQKQQVHDILVTHLAWVQRKWRASYGKDPNEHAWYAQRITITEALLPLFAAPPVREEEDEDAEPEELRTKRRRKHESGK